MARVVVTGGAGYVGAVLVPRLLDAGHAVRVLDAYSFGDEPLTGVRAHPRLQEIAGDLRDTALLARALPGCDAVIHLACISNARSFELDPERAKSINFDAFEPLVRIARQAGVQRFVYASTCSAYGTSDAEQVTEDHALLPITDYDRYKGLCEPVLARYQSPDFTTVTIRSAAVCGYSPRQRLDLSVNSLTNLAVNEGTITVSGGRQTRPDIHIDDLCDLYAMLLDLPAELIAGETFNAGYRNASIAEIAEVVRKVVSSEVPGREQIDVVTLPSDDIGCCRISSEKIARKLGFKPKRGVEDAVRDLVRAFAQGLLPSSLEDPKYFNIRTLQELKAR